MGIIAYVDITCKIIAQKKGEVAQKEHNGVHWKYILGHKTSLSKFLNIYT